MAVAGGGLSEQQLALQREVTNTIKVILSSIKANQLPMEQLHKEYIALVGTPIPVKQLHHATLASFLQSVPNSLRLKNSKGQLSVQLVNENDKKQGEKSNKKTMNNQTPSRKPRGNSTWVPPHSPHGGGARSYSQGYSNQYYTKGNWNIPRAIRNNQTKQFAPYYEIPPRMLNANNSKEGSKSGSPTKTYKQLLEEKTKKLFPEETLVFRTIPCGKKKTSWLSTVTFNNKKYTSYPDEKAKPEEAEEVVSKKVLETLNEINATKPTNYAITSDLNTSVARVKQILAGQEKTMFLQYITETYEKKHNETLPKNWCIDVKNTKNIGLIVDNPCKGVWTVMLAPVSTTNSNRNGSINNSNSPRRATQQYQAYNTQQQLRHPPKYQNKNIYSPYQQTQQVKQQAEQQINQQQTSYAPPMSPVECKSHPLTSDDSLSNTEQQLRHPPKYQDQNISSLPYQQTHQVNQQQVQQQINQQQTSLTSEDSILETSLPPLAALMIGLQIDKTSNESQEPVQLPSLKMPESNFWDVYCTYIKDCNNIYFRFIGDDYSNAYDDLVTDMELYYMEDKNLSPVTTPTFGAIYAASHDESWYRVQLLGLDGDEASVVFIDHGDREVISLKKLHHLKKSFGDLSAQGVQSSLAGLDFAQLDGASLMKFQQMALGKPLVAQVMSRYVVPSVVLFDTSTDDDVNINEKVCEHIESNFSEPHFPSVGGVAEVYVSHATSAGDIFVQIETETFKVLENIMDIVRGSIKDAPGEELKIDQSKFYLARSSANGEWYRASPRSKVEKDGKILVWFVDLGNWDRVAPFNLRPLEGIGERLAKIPKQVLLCRLYNVPSTGEGQWTQRVCDRLFDLVPIDTPLLLKVQVTGSYTEPPLVELFKRLQPQNELVSINTTLALDTELFIASGDGNNNSVAKDSLTSPVHSPVRRSRSRQSSTSSVKSSGLNSGPSSLNSCTGGDSAPTSPLPSSPRLPISPQPSSPRSISRPQSPQLGIPAPDIPNIGEFFDVFITYAANPSHFAVQGWKQTKKLELLMDQLQQHYQNVNNCTKDVVIEVGGYYAVKHSDNTWYRAHINMFQSGMVSGLFVDYGDCFFTSSDLVQPLHDSFRSLPYQAIKARLGAIAPKNGDWMPEDSCHFREMVERKEFVSVITDIDRQSSSSLILTLRLIDTSNPNLDVYIDEIIVKEGRAVKK